ncbi:hypothetical protein HLB23_03300 [Nocardia uniformis]|uniref:Uncharacterized protein n=1 Tax=Nocardia uniformis TaxID=53432 RepID=A0A849C7G0_9NOCA|nr:hypothetical protein [Nocardia uniformis]NNH68911.1 hypothetical protein [Nocardia uniformis]
MVPAIGLAGAGSAQARVTTFTCTAESFGGDAMPPVTVESKYGVRAAIGLAKTEWRGQAKFSTIECKPS